MIEVGKLYSCSKYSLLLFADKETANTAVAALWQCSRSSTASPIGAAYWTRELARKLGKPVSYCNPETPLLVLFVKEEYIEVLAGDKKGWFINMDWLEIKDIR
jgi:hypothetical protein